MSGKVYFSIMMTGNSTRQLYHSKTTKPLAKAFEHFVPPTEFGNLIILNSMAARSPEINVRRISI